MRTARTWGLPVTVLLGYRLQDGMFSLVDRLAALALQAHEDSICSGCNLPHEVTHGDHNVGRIEFRDDGMCHGCVAKAELVDNKNRITFPGQEIYPVDLHRQ